MKAPIACPNCLKTSIVRVEHVITGVRAHNFHVCGECEHEWETVEAGDAAAALVASEVSVEQSAKLAAHGRRNDSGR